MYNNPPTINDSRTTAKQRELQAADCHRDPSRNRKAPESDSSEDSYLEDVFDKVYKKKAGNGQPNKKKGSNANSRTRIEDQGKNYLKAVQSDEDNDDNEMYGWPKSKLISLLNKYAVQMKGLEEALNAKEENIQSLSSRIGERKSKGKELRKFSKEMMGELDRLYRDYGFLKEDLNKSNEQLEALRSARREQEREVMELTAALSEKSRQLKDSEHRGKGQASEVSEQYRIISELRETIKFAEKEREARGREADTRIQVMESQFSSIKDDWLSEK
jgi:chromosome segregation ATPase